jgi:ABC-type multidrug transport system ATPase subunit
MIEVTGLTVRRGARRVLDDASFTWPAAALALVGANGSGKSTLLRALVGAIERERGSVTIDGCSLDDQREALQRRCALVPEEPSYPGHLTVCELVELCAGLRRASVPSDGRSSETLSVIGGQRYETLSLGQRKRAHLLFARVEAPPWWLLDEPSDGLDQRARESLYDELTERGHGALIATHDPALIERCAGVLQVRDGKLERER